MKGKTFFTFVVFTNRPRMATTITELIKLLEADGWILARSAKHKVYQHPTKATLSGRPLTVPHGSTKELKQGTLNNILKDAGLK
jgi:predicted RNA binding protein YcfA (HicA-like mRNA interferase family)